MVLKSIGLQDFRNYERKNFELGSGTTVFVGPNAVGKTNILEAIYLISTGNSFKAKRIEEMIRFGAEYGQVEAEVDEEKLTVILTRGELLGKRVMKRRYLVSDVPKRKVDFGGRMSSVAFRPEDLDLMDGQPSLRRRWLDGVLIQADSEYRRSLMAYEAGLRRRNKILEAIREGIANRFQLTFWDGLLIKHGNVLTDRRESLVNYINEVWRRSELFSDLRLEYDKSIVSEKRFLQYKKEEVAAGHTLVGPHKDDFLVLEVKEGKRDLAVYGSRGEKRMSVLGLKMGELLFLEEKLRQKPLLLLDDIFSELDEIHTKEVQRVMIGRQVVVTTTDVGDVEGVEGVKVIELS